MAAPRPFRNQVCGCAGLWDCSLICALTANCPGLQFLYDDVIISKADMAEKVIAKMKEVMVQFYSETPKESDDVSRIISVRHAERIASMLDDPTITIEQGASK